MYNRNPFTSTQYFVYRDLKQAWQLNMVLLMHNAKWGYLSRTPSGSVDCKMTYNKLYPNLRMEVTSWLQSNKHQQFNCDFYILVHIFMGFLQNQLFSYLDVSHNSLICQSREILSPTWKFGMIYVRALCGPLGHFVWPAKSNTFECFFFFFFWINKLNQNILCNHFLLQLMHCCC